MKENSKWLVRAGSLLVMLGFFLPSVAVSCTAMPMASQSLSLNDLAGYADQTLLYLVLLGGLAALILAFIPASDKDRLLWFLIGQAAGLGLGALSIFVSVLSLSSQMQRAGFNVNLEVGFFILLIGYGMAGAGLFRSFTIFQQLNPRSGSQTGPPVLFKSPEPGRMRAGPGFTGPRLEVVRGPAASPIPIDREDFQIGRGKSNHLVLQDRIVSGLHARLRYAQGAWYIQDQNSSNGIFVNGRRVPAQRLNDGDKITIGESTFLFRS
jgi:hypothetical protein